jgi:hypothetical protein
MKKNYFSIVQLDFKHCKKRLSNFPSPARMSLTKLSLGGNNLIIPVKGEFDCFPVTSRMGTGKSITFFYSVNCSGQPARTVFHPSSSQFSSGTIFSKFFLQTYCI